MHSWVRGRSFRAFELSDLAHQNLGPLHQCQFDSPSTLPQHGDTVVAESFEHSDQVHALGDLKLGPKAGIRQQEKVSGGSALDFAQSILKASASTSDKRPLTVMGSSPSRRKY